MIMKTIILIASFAGILAASSSAFSQWVQNPAVMQDSIGHYNEICGNFGNDLHVDSISGPYPYLSLATRRSELSPDGRYIATWLYTDPPYILVEGVLIFDRLKHIIVEFFPGANFPHWSPDGTMLVCTQFIYDFVGKKIIPFPSAPTILYHPVWSVDGEHIYYSAGGQGPGMYRSTKDGKNMEPIESRYNAVPISLDEMIHIESSLRDKPKGYTIIDIVKKESRFVTVPEFAPFDDIRSLSISPSKRWVALDVNYLGGSRFNKKQALYIFDLHSHRLKKLLPGQAFANLYYPSWSSDSTLLISFVCRLDSACSTWEIDTNGVFLRQLLSKDILNVPTSTGKLDKTPDDFTISSVYPHPGNGATTVEYDVQKTGYLSFVLIDLSGREVRSVKRDSWHEPGRHAAHFRTDDLPAGLYLLRLSRSGAAPVYRKLIVE